MFDAAKTKDALVNWIRDYFEKNGKDCNAVIGISGGKDSATTAALCVKAIGADRVYGILMPNGDQYDIEIARKIGKRLGIMSITINIKPTVDALLNSIDSSAITVNRQAAVNIPARIRMTTLYAVSAILNGRVANTCNLSEDWVGYSTKYGDSAGDFSPLAHLTVTEVKAVGRELLPAKYIEKTPEDGLSGLSDEENLGFTYAVLDRYIREGICEDAAVKEKIDRLHSMNRHKLELMPSFPYTPDK